MKTPIPQNPAEASQVMEQLARPWMATRRIYSGVARALDEFVDDEANAEMDSAASATRSQPATGWQYRVLNQSLADCIDLQLQARQASWNVLTIGATGDGSLSRLFEEIACALGIHAANIAEEILRLGGAVRATLTDVAEHTRLSRLRVAVDNAQPNIDAVARAFGVISASIAQETKALAAAEDGYKPDALGDLVRTSNYYLQCLEARQAR